MADYRKLGNRYEVLQMIQQVRIGDELYDVDIVMSPNGITAALNGTQYSVSRRDSGKFTVTIEGIKHVAACVIKDNKIFADVDGVLFDLTVPSEDMDVAGGADSAVGVKDKIFAPMPGKVVKILVAVGQEVKAKQPMVIVEAMKMENQVNCAADGTVKKINFKDGDQVDTETPIIELELVTEQK